MVAPGNTIALARDRAALARCYPVMLELRPHLTDPGEFITRVERQQTMGYRLAYLESAGEVRTVTGYRLLESLSAGKFLYVDDLVTRAADASKGYGGAVFDWLIACAREANCAQLRLDSGVQRHGAHRFYLRKGMDITCHHFGMKFPALGVAVVQSA